MLNSLKLRLAMYIASVVSLLGLYFSLVCGTAISNDSPEPWGIGFQDGVSPGYTGIVELHDNIFFYLVVIAILVFWMLGSTIYYFNYDRTKITHKYLVHGTLIEILWTIFPAIVLLAIAIPSFRLLYILDEVTLPTITVKVTGHQWYWSYEYSDYETESGDPIEFDSYMIPDSDLEIGQTRLLEVDNPIVLPENTHVRFIVTSTDVLHDFAIPSAGIKIDATPGRLNQSSFFSEREGELFGQCSELCGTYHGFMPIQVEVGTVEDYLSWISTLAIFSFFSDNNLLKTMNPKNILKPLLKIFDGFLLVLVIYYFSLEVLHFIIVISTRLNELYLYLLNDTNNLSILSNDVISYMTDNIKNNTREAAGTQSTVTTHIIHNDSSSQFWKTIAIYSTGLFRVATSSGTPASKTLIMCGTIAADTISRTMTNASNDPTYIETQATSISNALKLFKSSNSNTTDAGQVQEFTMNPQSPLFRQIWEATAAKIGNGSNEPKNFKKLLPDSNDLEALSNKISSSIMEMFRPILEPVTVNYSNELLANQIHDIGILSFILLLLIMMLFAFFLISVIILLYSDRIINFFNIKLIRWYLNLNKKFIAVETFLLGSLILYFMYNLSIGLHFIATHPITFT